jgi:hypothetical protein
MKYPNMKALSFGTGIDIWELLVIKAAAIISSIYVHAYQQDRACKNSAWWIAGSVCIL